MTTTKLAARRFLFVVTAPPPSNIFHRHKLTINRPQSAFNDGVVRLSAHSGSHDHGKQKHTSLARRRQCFSRLLREGPAVQLLAERPHCERLQPRHLSPAVIEIF